MKVALILAGTLAFGTTVSAAPPATTPGGTVPATPATPADPAAGTSATPATPAQPAVKASTDDAQATSTAPTQKKKKNVTSSATSPDGVGVATPGAAKATKAPPKKEPPSDPQ